MKRNRKIALLLASAFLLSSPNIADAAMELIPHHNQSLKHHCEANYLGKGVVDSAGEVLVCVKKSSTERGWVLAPSKNIPGSSVKCSKIKASKSIAGLSYTCLKFADGLKLVKNSVFMKDANTSQSTPAPSAAPITPTPDPSAVQMTSSKAGTGTGGGAGNGTGGGRGVGGAPPAPTATP